MMIHHLGGWKLLALRLDDFSGNVCNEGKCPLVKAVNKALGGGGGTIFHTIDVSSASNEVPQ